MQEYTVFYVNQDARGINIESFFRHTEGAEIWNAITAAALEHAPELRPYKRRGFDTLYLPPDEADKFIERLAGCMEQNYDYNTDMPLLDDEKPIGIYTTNAPHIFEHWIRDTLQEYNNN